MLTETTMTVAMLLAFAVFVVPRKWFLLPFVVGACFIPADQRIIISGLDFTMLRILVTAGVLRLFLYGETVPIRWNRIDMLVILWMASAIIIYTALWGTTDALINRLGYAFDAIGLTWIFRQKIRSWIDLQHTALMFAWCAIGLVPLVAFEWSTGNNPFELLGRVATATREGRYRCQAAFPHSIMLGLFWATLLPLFIAWSVGPNRNIIFRLAVAAAIFIIFATASSTPVVAMIQILMLLALWKYRRHGRYMILALVAMLTILHIVMNKPVWHLIARANIVGGSTGWHRYFLIDQAINRFNEWWLMGTHDTEAWGRGLGDITNHFILQGVSGGILTLGLFVAILVISIRTLAIASLVAHPRRLQWISWCLCVSFLAHCISFIAVSYFGQIMMLLYMMIAVSATVYGMLQQTQPVMLEEPSLTG